MTYYVYAKPCGNPYISQESLDGNMLAHDYIFVYQTEEKPNLNNHKFKDGAFQEIIGDSDYVINRRASYPKIANQLDSLWHAMDNGIFPKAEPFYSDIKAVKDKYPKE